MRAIDQLKSVLCDPDGKCCIASSEEDRAIVDRALETLAQPQVQEPLGHCTDRNLVTTVRALTQVQEPVKDGTLCKVIACFDAAIAEGLFDAINETKDERLKDLLERRVMCAYYAAIGPTKRISPSQPQVQEPLDYCTDPYNCRRCKTHPNHRWAMEHAGIGKRP